MKRILSSVLFYTLFTTIILGCKKEESINQELVFLGKLTYNSTCKDYRVKSKATNDFSCVEYSFDEDSNKLILKHINAGFNCCPDSLYIRTFLSNNTIIIKEYEAKAQCKCQCLYDLDIELTGVEAKKYKIKFIEPYATKQKPIIFDINLEKEKDGKYCVIRNLYPWAN